MIQFPRRSVTRFFIPLIDVLILLFCIFLFMPMVKLPQESTTLENVTAELRRVQAERDKMVKEKTEVPEDLLDMIRKLQGERVKALEKILAVRVLEIDPETGTLYRTLPDRRIELTDEKAARELIDADRRKLEKDKIGGAEARELYYLILFPRDPRSPFPTRGQRETFEQWFQDVAHGYDIPGLGFGNQGDMP